MPLQSRCTCKLGFAGDGYKCSPIDPCRAGNGGCHGLVSRCWGGGLARCAGLVLGGGVHIGLSLPSGPLISLPALHTSIHASVLKELRRACICPSPRCRPSPRSCPCPSPTSHLCSCSYQSSCPLSPLCSPQPPQQPPSLSSGSRGCRASLGCPSSIEGAVILMSHSYNLTGQL